MAAALGEVVEVRWMSGEALGTYSAMTVALEAELDARGCMGEKGDGCAISLVTQTGHKYGPSEPMEAGLVHVVASELPRIKQPTVVDVDEARRSIAELGRGFFFDSVVFVHDGMPLLLERPPEDLREAQQLVGAALRINMHDVELRREDGTLVSHDDFVDGVVEVTNAAARPLAFGRRLRF